MLLSVSKKTDVKEKKEKLQKETVESLIKKTLTDLQSRDNTADPVQLPPATIYTSANRLAPLETQFK